MSIPVRIENDQLIVAMANPLDQIALEDLERTTGKHIQTIVAPLSDITAAIVRYYGTNFNDEPTPKTQAESLRGARQ